MMKKTLHLIVLMLLLCKGYSFAQANRVTGKVTNQDSTPLIGVNIQVSGANQSTTSDNNGSFSIDAPANSTLVFSYIGYVN